MHRSSIPVGICLTVFLAIRARTGGQRAATIVYGACVLAMLTVSGIYHAPRLSQSERRFLRRLDHATILVAIAGTYTAVIVLGMSGTTRIVLLVLMWLAPTWVVGAVYLGSGWMLIVYPPAFFEAMSGVELGLLAAGGGLYTIGSIIFARQKPNPWPSTFGYHEIWHAFVVTAAFFHWLAIYLLAG
jgi:hemolysin III